MKSTATENRSIVAMANGDNLLLSNRRTKARFWVGRMLYIWIVMLIIELGTFVKIH
jgi:hypothetical protein